MMYQVHLSTGWNQDLVININIIQLCKYVINLSTESERLRYNLALYYPMVFNSRQIKLKFSFFNICCQ
jgi:hypothetical protein